MNDSTTGRAAPEVVFIPPPADLRLPPKRMLGPLGACLIGIGLVLVVATMMGQGPLFLLLLMSPMIPVVALIVLVQRAYVHGRVDEQRSGFLRRRAIDEEDPLVRALAKCWTTPDRPPAIGAVSQALESVARKGPLDGPDVVCFGEPDAPAIGDLRFEPVVITPTAGLWRQFIWLATGGFIMIWWLLGRLPFVPLWFPRIDRLMSGLLYFVLACLVTLGVWAWRALVHPTYIRLAPGVIQLLEYCFVGGQPKIRNYRMQGGTLVVLVRQRKRMTVYLSCEGRLDVLSLWQMRCPEEALEHVWQAVLSTAPTPPLSTETLLG